MSDEVKFPDPATPRMGIFPDRYTVDQLRAYGEACRQDEREKCVHDCKMLHIGMPGHDEWNSALRDAAFRIRARSAP